MKTCWIQSGNVFYPGEISSQIPKLPIGLYQLNQNPMTGQFSLSKIGDKFTFSHKIYGLQTDFVTRTRTTYDNTTDNLGILLNGIKGTGKSVTVKMICNEMNLPVILVDQAYKGFDKFIADIQQEIVVFIDEYEKIFKDSSEVLTIMDGIFTTAHRRVFLLTTNNLYINENMLQRPGRLRYVKAFGDLEPEVTEEIIDDLLENKEFRSACIQTISTLEIVTIDLVKAILNEVNIHDESPEKFINYFNVNNRKREEAVPVTVFELEGSKPSETPLMEDIIIDYSLYKLNVGHWLRDTDYNNIARVVEKYGQDMFKIQIGYNLAEQDDFNEDGTFDWDTYDDKQEVLVLKEDGKDVFYIRTTAARPARKVFHTVKIVEPKRTHHLYGSMSQVL